MNAIFFLTYFSSSSVFFFYSHHLLFPFFFVYNNHLFFYIQNNECNIQKLFHGINNGESYSSMVKKNNDFLDDVCTAERRRDAEPVFLLLFLQ